MSQVLAMNTELTLEQIESFTSLFVTNTGFYLELDKVAMRNYKPLALTLLSKIPNRLDPHITTSGVYYFRLQMLKVSL